MAQCVGARGHSQRLVETNVATLDQLGQTVLEQAHAVGTVGLDESAHLMDAVLALDGKVPLVDFDSRQPLYVYINALFLKLFGISYTAGRLLPLTCSLLIGIFVYLIANTLFEVFAIPEMRHF